MGNLAEERFDPDASDSENTGALPSLSVAAPNSADWGENSNDDTVQLRRAAGDFVDDDETLPLPTLDADACEDREQAPGWWTTLKAYIGI